jgi:hypothetical protein
MAELSISANRREASLKQEDWLRGMIDRRGGSWPGYEQQPWHKVKPGGAACWTSPIFRCGKTAGLDAAPRLATKQHLERSPDPVKKVLETIAYVMSLLDTTLVT